MRYILFFRNFSNRGLLNDPADQGPRLESSKTRAISESKEKKGIHVLSQGENMLFFLRLANALKQFDLPNLGPWSALAFMRNWWNRLACSLFEKLPFF